MKSIHMVERLTLLTLDHEVLGSNPARGRIQVMIVQRFMTKRLSLPSHSASRYDLNDVERIINKHQILQVPVA